MKISLQLNDFLYDKNIQKEMNEKNIEFEELIMNAQYTIKIYDVCEIRYDKEFTYIIIDNYNKSLEIKTKYIKYMNIE